jgi:hypothetical protein
MAYGADHAIAGAGHWRAERLEAAANPHLVARIFRRALQAPAKTQRVK